VKLASSLFIALLGAAWLAAFVFYLQQPINHDTAWYLAATPRFLDGARLYRDIIEINPPLAFYLTVPPVLAARLTGLSIDSCFVAYVLLLSALSLALADYLMARMPELSTLYRRCMLAAILAAFMIIPMPFFGQREHLTFILALPYLLLVASRVSKGTCPPTAAIIIGALAAFGLGLKPYFLVVPALLEMYGMLVHRSMRFVLRPENWTIGIALVVYAASILLFTPDYLTFVVPMASLVYGAYAESLDVVIGSMPMVTFILAIILYITARATKPAHRPADVFALAAVGFTVAYFMQSKGWLYHLIPAICALWLMGVSFVLRNGAPTRGNAPLHVGFALLAYLVLGAKDIAPYRNTLAEDLLPIVEKQAAHGTVAALTSYVWVGFPLVNEAHVGWASRFPALWLLPGAMRQLQEADQQDPAIRQKLQDVERYTVDSVIEDLQRSPPDLVFVDQDSPYFGTGGFDFLDYFGRDPRFAVIWNGYVHIGEASMDVGGRRRFEIWCRRYADHDCAT